MWDPMENEALPGITWGIFSFFFRLQINIFRHKGLALSSLPSLRPTQDHRHQQPQNIP